VLLDLCIQQGRDACLQAGHVHLRVHRANGKDDYAEQGKGTEDRRGDDPGDGAPAPANRWVLLDPAQ
jgi:hypothetical protein